MATAARLTQSLLVVLREFGLDEEVTALTRKAAEPFMEWLRTDDGSEEEEIDVAY